MNPVSYTHLDVYKRQPYEPRRGRPVAFLDIAAGGDETVLAICDGNEAWIEYAERQREDVYKRQEKGF